jgi:hypothetical protein
LVNGLDARLFAGELEHMQNGRGQRGFAVVDVADGADVDVGLGAIESYVCHKTK